MKFGKRAAALSDICDSDQFGRILKSDQSGRSSKLLAFKQPKGARRVNVLTDLRIGETAVLVALDLPDSVQNYLMHMGFVPDALVKVLRRAPAGDPTVFGIDGMEIALRHETAAAIRVQSVGSANTAIPAKPADISALAEVAR